MHKNQARSGKKNHFKQGEAKMYIACSSIVLLKAKQRRERKLNVWVKEWLKNSLKTFQALPDFLKSRQRKISLNRTSVIRMFYKPL